MPMSCYGCFHTVLLQHEGQSHKDISWVSTGQCNSNEKFHIRGGLKHWLRLV